MSNILTIDDLRTAALTFRDRLEKLKKENPLTGFTWYGYDILGNVQHISKLLTRENRNLFGGLVGKHVADIGAADGDLSFFLETLGITSHMIDYAPTNWNGLNGARLLKSLLNSNVEIYEVNLDDQFRVPFDKYELILFLGILYHLKNPFYVLEKLSGITRYLILSTRTANLSRKEDGIDYTNEPMAYLLAPAELNNDPTNYWIFSRKGLMRLVERTGWQVKDFMTVGTDGISTPQDMGLDQRAFMLLESKR